MIRIAAWTHVGRVRERNEDAVALPGLLMTGSPFAPVALELPVPQGAALHVVAVIDGMGGHAGGQEASRLIGIRLTGPVSDQAAALQVINDELFDEMARRPELTAMGATIAGFAFGPDFVEVFNIGDARAYRHLAGYTTLLSVDDRGAEASNVITQSLGGTSHRSRPSVHLERVPVLEPVRFLLCTDGLSEFVAFATIQTTLGVEGARDAAQRLVEAALEAGAPDNVSVVVIDVDGTDPVAGEW